jgi:hypothetical protein
VLLPELESESDEPESEELDELSERGDELCDETWVSCGNDNPGWEGLTVWLSCWIVLGLLMP